MTPRWSQRWVLGREVFTAPDGTEWLRANPETAELTIPSRTPGLGPLHLKRGASEGIRKAAARKARRLERRTKRLHQQESI